MAGGAPAGIIKVPGEELCRTTSAIIRIMTIQGKRSTAPRGTDIFELPFNRIRRLKNDNFGVIRSFSFVKSWRPGRLGDEGILFAMLLMNPIAEIWPSRWNQSFRPKGDKNNIGVLVDVD